MCCASSTEPPALARLQEASGVLAGWAPTLDGGGSVGVRPLAQSRGIRMGPPRGSHTPVYGIRGGLAASAADTDSAPTRSKVAPTGLAPETCPVWAWLSCPVRPPQGEGDWALVSDVPACFCPPPRSYHLPHVCHPLRGPTWPPGHWPLHPVSPLCIPSQAPWLPGSGSFWPLVL